MTLIVRPSVRAFSILALGLLLLLQPARTTVEPGQTIPVARRLSAFEWSQDEKRLMRLQNRARVERGLEALRWRRSLSAIARDHSRLMRSKGRIFHSSSAAPLYRFSWSLAGENVGVGPTMGSLFRAFMESPGHRANILHRQFDRVGVGVAMDGPTIYVTIIFLG